MHLRNRTSSIDRSIFKFHFAFVWQIIKVLGHASKPSKSWSRSGHMYTKAGGKPNGQIYATVNIFIEWLVFVQTPSNRQTDYSWRGVLLGAIASHSWNIYDFKVRVDVEGASIDHLPKALHIILSLSAYSLLHVIFHTKLQTLSRYASLHFHTISHSPTRSLSLPLACSRSIDI